MNKGSGGVVWDADEWRLFELCWSCSRARARGCCFERHSRPRRAEAVQVAGLSVVLVASSWKSLSSGVDFVKIGECLAEIQAKVHVI